MITTCNDCNKTFQSNPDYSITTMALALGRDTTRPQCYSCALKMLTRGHAPEEGDINSAFIISGELSPATWREMQDEFRRIDPGAFVTEDPEDEWDDYYDREPEPSPPLLCGCGRNEIGDYDYQCRECDAEEEERWKSYCLECGNPCEENTSVLCVSCETSDRERQEEMEAEWRQHEVHLMRDFFPPRPWKRIWWVNLWHLFDWFIMLRLRVWWILKKPRP